MTPHCPGELYLRISVTDRCQLRCTYCMPEQGIPLGSYDDILSYEEISRFAHLLHQRYQLKTLRITGGDPLARRDISRLVAALGDLGIPDLAMTTNAQQLAPLAAQLKAAGLDRVNISLDTLNPERFRALTRRGELAQTIEGIDAALEAGLTPVKLNMVTLAGANDDEFGAMLDFALRRGCELRFLELMPLGRDHHAGQITLVTSGQVREKLCERFTFDPIPRQPGSTAATYHVTDDRGHHGTVGFISPCSAPFCASCKRLRLTSTGQLLGCLTRSSAVNVRPLLADATGGNETPLFESVELALNKKSDGEIFSRQRDMSTVGG